MADAVLTLDEINQFLPKHKLTVDNLTSVAELQKSQISIVFGRLSQLYDTSIWVDSSSTPKLVKTIVAMLVAGNVYLNQFAEEGPRGDNYGHRRIREAYALLQSVIEGVMHLGEDAPRVIDPLMAPFVYPTEPIFEMEVQF